MELRQSQRRTRISKRVPLSNLTNAKSLSSSPSSALALKPQPKSSNQRSTLTSNSNLDAIPARSSSSIGSSGPKNPSDRRIPSSDQPVNEISTNLVADAIRFDKSKHPVVYARNNTEGRKDKGKVATAPVPFSCPPRERSRNIGSKLKAENRDVVVLGTSSVPYKKSKKIQKHAFLDDDEVLEKSLLPQDYIERQRAYFAEIDAYDLAEEVISDSELE